jgi:hypothetical protein
MWSRGWAARLEPPTDLDSVWAAQVSQPVFREATGMTEVCLVEVGPAVAGSAFLAGEPWWVTWVGMLLTVWDFLATVNRVVCHQDEDLWADRGSAAEKQKSLHFCLP